MDDRLEEAMQLRKQMKDMEPGLLSESILEKWKSAPERSNDQKYWYALQRLRGMELNEQVNQVLFSQSLHHFKKKRQ